MTRREAWTEVRQRLNEAPRAVVVYEREGLSRVVIGDRQAGFIEVELGPHDPFVLLDLIATYLRGDQWSKPEAEARIEEAGKRYERERRLRAAQ